MNKTRQYLRLVKLYFHYSRLASAQQLYPVIFKCDDLARITKSVKILDFLTKLFCVKLSWGIIGKSLQNPSTRYVAWLKKRYASGRYHFFNHGYFHLCEKEYEFDQKPLSYQTAMLRNTQTLAKKHLNITINTFGAKEKYISKALDSIFAQQTSYNFQVIISDDHSTDKTLSIIQDYQTKHPDKITLLTSDINQKLYKKADKVARIIRKFKRNDIIFEVDGNISFAHAATLKNLGANMFVAGTSSIFSNKDTIEKNILKLQNVLQGS